MDIRVASDKLELGRTENVAVEDHRATLCYMWILFLGFGGVQLGMGPKRAGWRLRLSFERNGPAIVG